MGPKIKICLVVGARPNIPKIAPILAGLAAHAPTIESIVVHTGQHYDPELSSLFFRDLGLEEPHWKLEVGSGSHAVQTARIMMRFEERCLSERPGAVVVAGDVNSTVACTLVAAKLGIPVAHVEAGLRSGDRSMPEEINRLVTDCIADRLYTHCAEADENLLHEGVPPERIVRAGNVMIDSLRRALPRVVPPKEAQALNLEPQGFGAVTLHRPALVDHAERFLPMLEALAQLSEDLPLLYPIHPRSWARLTTAQAQQDLNTAPTAGEARPWKGSRLFLCRPLPYLEFLWCIQNARLVVTDSGGIQEETTSLGVPCITVRQNTERAVTIREGSNQLAGLDPASVLTLARRALSRDACVRGSGPALWDGRAGERIAKDLAAWVEAGVQGA